VLVSRFCFARKFSAQSFGSTFQRLAILSRRGKGDLGKQILDRKYVPFSSCQTILKNRKKIEEFGSFFHLLYKRGNLQHNGSAMVSTGIKSSELLIKHLAKTFYFVLSFYF
jgi:hypothetical protein